MKKTLPSFLPLVFSVFLYGCPYDSPYNLDESPLQNIDESLLGKWIAPIARPGNKKYAGKGEWVKIFFEKRTDMDYDLVITGHIEELNPYHVVTNDSIKGTAYLSAIAGKQFLNAYIHGKVYIAEVKKDNGNVSILPLAEYFTSKLIKNSRELRTAVEFHYKVQAKPGYDPFFCLKKLQRDVDAP
ncbi:MAG: hypothetical protein ABIQ31_19375 [Ferruginibacter sp.]